MITQCSYTKCIGIYMHVCVWLLHSLEIVNINSIIIWLLSRKRMRNLANDSGEFYVCTFDMQESMIYDLSTLVMQFLQMRPVIVQIEDTTYQCGNLKHHVLKVYINVTYILSWYFELVCLRFLRYFWYKDLFDMHVI